MEVVVLNGTLGSAMFSKDLRYRYMLARPFGIPDKRDICMFIMLNPSTADADVNDPTVARCIRYAKDWGHAGLLVANLFGLRATDPRELYRVADPFGENTGLVLAAARRPDVTRVVCAWGTHGKLHDAGEKMRRALYEQGTAAQALKLTRDGHPAHPLYLRGDLAPFPLGD